MTATANSNLPKAVDDFFARDIPEPFQILGLKLLPLSIGRYRRMARHGVGFVAESNVSADGKDLLLGVLICSMTCADWDLLVTSGDIPSLVSFWMRKINAAPPWYLKGKFGGLFSNTWLGKNWRKNHSFDLLDKMKLFKQYIEEAQKIPKFIRKNSGGGLSTAHWSQSIETVLRSELNWDSDDIDEQPLSKAIAQYYQFAEANGQITILTESDFKDIENNSSAIEKAYAEWLAKGGENGL